MCIFVQLRTLYILTIMLLSRSKDQLIITVENTFDWMDIFDSGIDNSIMFEVDGDNLEFFCPDWEIYIDHNKPFDTLRIDDVKQIKSLDIMLAPNIEDMGGKGFYDVVKCKFELTKEYIEEDGEEPNYDRFLDLVGTVTFKVTPDLAEV